VTGQVTLTVAKDWKDTINGKTQLQVTDSSDWSTGTFELKADKFSVVVNGSRIFELDKSGNVKISPKKLTLDGSDITLKGSKVQKKEAGSPPSAQVQALRIAAVEGVPFCEQCEARRRAESGSAT
jgi:type VI secretion system secreted protein VgrG